jgi:hypothetical protein
MAQGERHGSRFLVEATVQGGYEFNGTIRDHEQISLSLFGCWTIYLIAGELSFRL